MYYSISGTEVSATFRTSAGVSAYEAFEVRTITRAL